MFAGVHFDFQLKISLSTDFRSKPENKMDRVLCVLRAAFPEPRQCLANHVDCGADRLRFSLDQVNVFGIAQPLLKEQPVDCSSSSERAFLCQEGVVEQIA